MSACCNLRLCSLLKTVLNKLGDSYQTYCNAYKTHTMATHHAGAGQPLDKDIPSHDQGMDTQANYHHENMDNFKNAEQENQTSLKILTWDLDNLHHRVQAGEGQPIEA